MFYKPYNLYLIQFAFVHVSFSSYFSFTSSIYNVANTSTKQRYLYFAFAIALPFSCFSHFRRIAFPFGRLDNGKEAGGREGGYKWAARMGSQGHATAVIGEWGGAAIATLAGIYVGIRRKEVGDR